MISDRYSLSADTQSPDIGIGTEKSRIGASRGGWLVGCVNMMVQHHYCMHALGQAWVISSYIHLDVYTHTHTLISNLACPQHIISNLKCLQPHLDLSNKVKTRLFVLSRHQNTVLKCLKICFSVLCRANASVVRNTDNIIQIIYRKQPQNKL